MTKSSNEEGVVVFDFDGVIGDTVGEHYGSALEVYNGMGHTLEHSPRLERRFRKLRPFIHSGKQFYTMLHIAQYRSGGLSNLTQEEFDRIDRLHGAQVEEFGERLAAHRKRMIAEHPEEWYALQPMFPGMREFIERSGSGSTVYIATTKDRPATLALLKRYGIDIPEERVFTKENSHDKRQQLQQISEHSGVPVGELVLVEDCFKQAREAKEIGAHAVFARWGYSSKAQKKEAGKAGIPKVRRWRFGAGRVRSLAKRARRAK
jgi:phosphoglycolate phosphatase-like HAD superfamily hydrolase